MRFLSASRKAETLPPSRDLTPSEIESLRRDAQESLEEMNRLDAEEESQETKLSRKVPAAFDSILKTGFTLRPDG
jgi:hypothetical protein